MNLLTKQRDRFSGNVFTFCNKMHSKNVTCRRYIWKKKKQYAKCDIAKFSGRVFVTYFSQTKKNSDNYLHYGEIPSWHNRRKTKPAWHHELSKKPTIEDAQTITRNVNNGISSNIFHNIQLIRKMRIYRWSVNLSYRRTHKIFTIHSINHLRRGLLIWKTLTSGQIRI